MPRKRARKTTKRTVLKPHKGDRRYVRRTRAGRFKKEVRVGRSLAADRACRTLELLAATDCARTGTCQDPDLTRCRSDSHRPASRHWVWDFCSCRTCGRLVAEGANGFAGAAAQIYADEKIDDQGCSS